MFFVVLLTCWQKPVRISLHSWIGRQPPSKTSSMCVYVEMPVATDTTDHPPGSPVCSTRRQRLVAIRSAGCAGCAGLTGVSTSPALTLQTSKTAKTSRCLQSGSVAGHNLHIAVSLCLAVHGHIQTHKRFKITLFIRQNTACEFTG